MEIANGIAALTGGNGHHVSFTDASGKKVALLKSLGDIKVLLSATQLGLNTMVKMGYLSTQPHPDCAIIVRQSIFTDAEFTRWLNDYSLPENSTAILAPSNCVGVIALNKPLPINTDNAITTNWCGLTVFGSGIGVMQLAYCESLGYYVLLNHSMKTYIVIPDFLLSKELPYSDQNFEDFVHSEVLSDFSTEAHPFGVIM